MTKNKKKKGMDKIMEGISELMSEIKDNPSVSSEETTKRYIKDGKVVTETYSYKKTVQLEDGHEKKGEDE